jgi:hypothetical protein
MTVPYRGRRVDPTALWSNYVEFPGDFTDDGKTEFSPLTVCPNPDHLTSKRHFQINLKQPTVHCFAHCGISGTYEHAIAMIEGSTHRAARRAILKHSRVATGEALTRPRKRKSASAIPVVDLSYERYLPAVASEYLTSRALTPQSIERWELGWNPDELRVVIPATATISVRKRLPRTPIKVVRYPKSVKDPDPAKLAQNPEDVIRAIDRAISFSAWQRKAGISIPKPYKQRKEISFG